MKIFFKATGEKDTALTVIDDEIYNQGSVNVNNCYAFFAGKSPVNYLATIKFKRSDDSMSLEYPMIIYTFEHNSISYYGYRYQFNDEWILAKYGELRATVTLYNGSGSVWTTGTEVLPVAQTVYDDEPTITTTQYNLLMTEISKKIANADVVNKADVLPDLNEQILVDGVSVYKYDNYTFCLTDGSVYHIVENNANYIGTIGKNCKYVKSSEILAKGDVVQMQNATGGFVLVKKAAASEINAQPQLVLGVAMENFAANGFGLILMQGNISGINTSSGTDGAVVYYDSSNATAGKWTTTRPVAPNVLVILGIISNASNNGTMEIRLTSVAAADQVIVKTTPVSYTPAAANVEENLKAIDIAISDHVSDTGNPHSVTKTQIGLSNVDNTSDSNKPVSTATQTALNLKADQATTYTKTEVDSKVSSVYKLKGSVATYGNLPTTGQVIGDVWNVVANGANYVWTGSTWDELGTTVDVAALVKKTASLSTTLETAYSTLGREVAIDGTYGSYIAIIYLNGSTYDIRFIGTQNNGTRSAFNVVGTTTIGNAFGLATTDHAKYISGAEFAALATSIYTAGIYTILDDTSSTYLKGSTWSLSAAGVRTEIPLAYKNTTTGLSATTVQTAIDEVSNLTSKSEVIQAGINKYYPLLSNRAGQLLIRQITSIWNGSAWAATNSLGFGHYALQSNTGTYSNGFGYLALQYNIGAGSNGFGYSALQYNIGSNSNGFGHLALQNNVGSYSSGFGSDALYNNTGTSSSGFGSYALSNNTGSYSSGFGSYALRYNQKSNNTAIGYSAGRTFLPDTSKNKTCDYTAVDIVNESITIASHGFGAANEYVNIRYTSTTGTAIGGLVIGSIYQTKIIDANTIMFYDGVVTHNLSSQGTGTHTFTPQFAYTNVTLLGANTNASKDNQVVLGDTNVVNLKLGNYETTTAATAGINSTPTSVALTLESIIANTSGYFDTTGSGTSVAPYVIKPKLNISHSENLYVITSSEPASNTYVNIQSNGNMPCNVRYTYSTLFTTHFYALQILNSDGKVRPRLESNLNQTDYRSRITRIANLYTYKFELDINSSTPFVLNVLTNFTTTPLKTILIYNEWIAEGDVYKQTNGDLEGIIDEQNPILIGDIDLDYTSEYRDYTDLQIDTARSELSNVYRAVINSGGTVTYYSTSNAFTLSLPIIIRREK